METHLAKFAVGQLIRHQLFDYRGVVVDVDPWFRGDEDWYRVMAKSRPPKDRPWYHVLVDGHDYRAYVAEVNLKADVDGLPIDHPDIDTFFAGLGETGYLSRTVGN